MVELRVTDNFPTLGHEIVRLMALRGVDTVFGIPGAHNLELYRGLSAHPRIKHVVVRHEQGAGYAADGYRRISGKAAGVFVTSGPAVANVLAAAATAYADRVPMLVVSPGPEADRSWRQDGWLHLTKDQNGMTSGAFEDSVRAESPEGALWAINTFFLAWATGRSSLPMHLEVPPSMLAAKISTSVVEELPWYAVEGGQSTGILSDASFDQLRSLIRARGESPSFGIIVGREAASAGIAISEFASMTGALVVETGEGKGIVQPQPAGYLGASSEFLQSMQLIFDRDVVFVVGCELRYAEAALPDKHRAIIVRIGDDWLERNSNLLPDFAAAIDPGNFFLRLTADVHSPANANVLSEAASIALRVRGKIATDVPAYVLRFVELLEELTPHDPIYVGDSSQICYFGIAPLLNSVSAGSYINSFGYCTLGYSVPAGVGARLATDRPVACVTGDGALLFSIPELMTAAEQHLPLAIIVVDNGGYGEIRDEMVHDGIDTVGVDFAVPDLGSVARGFGAAFADLTSLADFRQLVEHAWQANRPTVIRISTDVLEATCP